MKYILGAIIAIILAVWGWFAYDPNVNMVLQNLTSNGTLTVPANYYLIDIVMENTTANSITGGLKVGTTSGGSDVVLGQAVGASSYLNVGSSISKKIFSSSSTTTLYIQAVTSWNSANVNIYFVFSKMK
jgi:hypothetical protein